MNDDSSNGGLRMNSNKRLRVGILFGGRSGEHEVSLASAASVIRALDPEKYEAVPIGITKDGRWLIGTNAHKLLPEVLKSGERVVLPPDPSAASLLPLAPATGQPSTRVDIVFPVLHGTFGEDGTVQGLLELAGLPYVGAGVLASAVGMDKDVQKRLFKEAGLPIVDYVTVTRETPDPVAACAHLPFPMFVKPANLGSSVGISKAHNPAELKTALAFAAQFDRKLVVERGIQGRELECAVLGNEEPLASLPCEILPSREFYDYDDKYLLDQAKTELPAKLTPEKTDELRSLAVACFRAVDCEGMGRVDFLL